MITFCKCKTLNTNEISCQMHVDRGQFGIKARIQPFIVNLKLYELIFMSTEKCKLFIFQKYIRIFFM